MNYSEAKHQILDGDMIAVRGDDLVDELTSTITHDPHTHTGVAMWLDGELFMADLNSGRNHLTMVSCVTNFDVYDPPAGLLRSKIRTSALAWLSKPINYGMLAFVVIGIKCALRLKTFIHWRKIIVCSGGSVQIYEGAGWGEHSRMISPGELASQLVLKLKVRAADNETSAVSC